MWANRPDDVWLVGGDGSMGFVPEATGAYAHFDGCAWTVTPRSDLSLLLGVWGAAPNDVWIVGTRGSAYHWDGSTLTTFPIPGAAILTSVHGTSGSDVWAVGNTGIFHWNGRKWILEHGMYFGQVSLIGVAADGPSGAWAVGTRFDGMTTHPFALHCC